MVEGGQQSELVILLFLDLQVLSGSARVSGDRAGPGAKIKKNTNRKEWLKRNITQYFENKRKTAHFKICLV